jgi:hypothetical protein
MKRVSLNETTKEIKSWESHSRRERIMSFCCLSKMHFFLSFLYTCSCVNCQVSETVVAWSFKKIATTKRNFTFGEIKIFPFYATYLIHIGFKSSKLQIQYVIQKNNFSNVFTNCFQFGLNLYWYCDFLNSLMSVSHPPLDLRPHKKIKFENGH